MALAFPGGKRFAFAVIDDTDVGTVENLTPVYRLLESLGIGATKTVWPMACPEGSRNFSSSETLDDPAYREFARDLQRRGFEMASHGATMESSERARTLAGLERFRETFGAYPKIHANHSYNRDNVYWGAARLDDAVLRLVYTRFNGMPGGHYQGHVAGSPYWWGDRCAQHVTYVRNLTFSDLNVLRVNPSMPYHDPARPLVRLWFSATDAEDVSEFRDLFRPERIDQLEREGGVCLLATHFGKGYARDGVMDAGARACLEDLARRPGWFPPVGELLDWLHQQRGDDVLPAAEWRRMQWRWARDLAVRQWHQRRRRMA